MTREYKTFQFQVKSTDDTLGTIEGYLSVFSVVDQGNDRVVKGAFKRTLINSKKRAKDSNNPYIFPMLWQHDVTQPIGGVTEAIEDDHGLLTTAHFDLDTQRGREAYSGYKKGYLNQLSIGYDVIKKTYDEKGVRNLEELRLWEQSTVTFAMNENALVTGVKAAKQNTMPKKDFNDRYRQQQISSWCSDFSDLSYALRQSIQDIFAVGDTPSTDLVDVVLNDTVDGTGFISALKAYIQEGIDLDYATYLQEQSDQSSSVYAGYMAAGGPDALKAGGMSQTKKDTIQAHIDNLHSMANEHKSTMATHTKAMHTAADDLASVLQGSEPAYTTDHGMPEKATSSDQIRSTKDHSSSADTDLSTAMAQLVNLRTMNK